jgi:hypothetical protein
MAIEMLEDSGRRGRGGLRSIPANAGLPETAKKQSRLGDFREPDNRAEELAGAENQAIIAEVIRASVAQEDPLEAPKPRGRHILHDQCAVEVAVVLASVDLCPRGAVLRAFGRPVLQMIPIPAFGEHPDRIVCWLDSQGLEVRTNSMAGSVFKWTDESLPR